jgi:hypothetical protein
MKQTIRGSREEEGSVRLSITFTQTQHDALMEMAARNDVSVGYVVRKACDAFFKNRCEDATLHELAEATNA